MFFNEEKKKLTREQFDKEVEKLIKWVQDSVSPFEGDTAEKQEIRVRRAREDQDFFNQTYLPHYFTDESPPFHREMEEIEEEGERQRRPSAIAAPRGHSKSTRITFAKRLKRVLFREKRFIIVVSSDETIASEFTVSMRVELEHNPRILHDFDKQKTGEWASEEFVASGGTKVLARGIGQRIRGLKHGPYRPDDIIIDDPEDDEMVKNPKRVEALVRWVREAVFPALEPKTGILSWVGTILSKRSALAKIIEDKAWVRKIYSAVADGVWDDQAEWDEAEGEFRGAFTSGIPLWPTRFPLSELSRIRRIIGSPAFNKEYQNKPSDDDAMFQEKWIRRVPWDSIVERRDLALWNYAGRDPSAKHGESNDFKAHVTVARGSDGHLYVRYASIKRISVNQMVLEDYWLVPRFNVLQLGVEAEGLQELFLGYYNAEALKQGFYLPIVPIERKGVSKDDEARIGGLSPLAERGVLIFCTGPASEVGDMPLLIEQLLDFPSGVVEDDGPDGLETGVHLAYRKAMIGRPSYERVAQREARFEGGAY